MLGHLPGVRAATTESGGLMRLVAMRGLVVAVALVVSLTFAGGLLRVAGQQETRGVLSIGFCDVPNPLPDCPGMTLPPP